MRYRLIPTLGVDSPSFYVHGRERALAVAEEAYEATVIETIEKGETIRTGVPILVVEAPPDGLVQSVTIVGGEYRRRRG